MLCLWSANCGHEINLLKADLAAKDRTIAELRARLFEAESRMGELTALIDEASSQSHDYHEKYYPEAESLRPKRAESVPARKGDRT